MNPDQIISHLKKLVSTLSGRQLAGLAAVFLAVVAIVVGSAYWISEPQYTLLVADMDAETANSVVSKLKDEKVAYRLGDGGRTVSVPVERADELRLQFASGGLPSAGRIGFEIFDRTAFGTTEFLEHVNYRRALEGELARTISTLAEVASARVHIAMAKDSLFLNQSEAAKASVVLRLKSNRPLPAATVRGIAGLVAGSVESLRPEAVVILDTYGRPLTRSTDDPEADAGNGQLDRQQQIERELTNRVVTLLEPVVGPGRVRVNVAAYLKTDSVEETAEVWDPSSVVRSRQTSSEAATGLAAAGGVAGARANQPPALSTATAAPVPSTATLAAAPANAAAGRGASPAAPASVPVAPAPTSPPGTLRTSETTNFEVSRTTRHTLTPPGQLARLSVAVILDDERTATTANGKTEVTAKPWDASGIQRIHGLVAAAVGLNPDRGDQLTVENIAFDVPSETPMPAPGVTQEITDTLKQQWPMAVRGLAVLALALVALFGVLRPLAQRAGALATTPALPAPAATAARLPTVQEMEGHLDGIGAGPDRRLPALTQRVAKLANDEPEQLARIVRGWISEGQK